jgi:hypothetical protein
MFEVFSKIRRKNASFIKSDNNKGYYIEYLCAYMTVALRILLEMRNVSGQLFRENKNIQFMFNTYFFFENHAF